MTDLEKALELIGDSRRKASKSSAWACAEQAAEIAGVRVYQEERSNYPDLARLEKDVRAALGDETIIVTRHSGLVEWLRQHGITGRVVEQANAETVRGKRVYGVLPLHLAAEAAKVVTVDMPRLPREKRGVDLSPEEMDEYGAIMTAYVVIRS